MYIFKHEKFILLPLAYNDFSKDIESLRESKKYAGEIKIHRIIDSYVIEKFLEYCNENKEFIYVLDMKYVISYENKIFKKLLESESTRIIIVNIDRGLVDSIKEDLNDKYIAIRENVLCSDNDLEKVYVKYCDDIQNIYHEEAVAIVDWMKQNVVMDNIRDLKPLDSSGVYCNMYINAKRLFIDPDKYRFIIYQMICMIIESGQEIDALVSASRNGANIASVIGWLLNKKVIHCTSLGPKFSLAASSVYKEIRKNKKYVYIFDFMCLGTEAKLLNALLSFKGANLLAGYGIANYINLDNGTKNSVFNKMNSLVDVQKEKIGYRIAGSKDEIAEMLIKENNNYVSKLCRV